MTADPKQAHLAREFEAEAPLMACRFDPTGRFVFATAEDRLIYRWELSSGKRTTLAGHESWIGDLAISADGQTLISAGYDDTLIWWPAAADAPLPSKKVKAHDGWIRSVALSPDGRFLASGGNDRVVRLWNAGDGAKVRELPGHERDIYSLLFHPGGEWLVSGDLMGSIRQWETASGHPVRTLEAGSLHTYNTSNQRVHYGGVRAMAFSAGAKWLAVGGLHKATNPLGNVQEPLAVRFDWESGKAVRNHLTENIPTSMISGMQFHPQGFLIGSTAGFKGKLAFWNEADEKPFKVLDLPNTARGLALHPDGLQIATAHHDRKLRLTRLGPKVVA